MKLASFLLFSTAIAGSSAFSVQHAATTTTITSSRHAVKLSAASNNDDISDSWQHQMGKLLATGLVTASLWAAPVTMQQNFNHFDNGPQLFPSTVANAKQMASASGSRVNKDPESLLRYGLPINSKEVQ